MAENPLLDEVVAMYFHLVDNPDDARALLDDAHFNAAENGHEIAMVGIQLRHIQHQTNELMTQPMTDAEREAQRVQLEEDYRGIKVDADFLLENRRRLRQVVKMLVFIWTYAIIRRALRRFLPAVALTFVAGTAALAVYVELRRGGTVPAFEALGRIFTWLTSFFLLGYRSTLALLAEVAAICEQLVDDPDAAKIMLDSVLSGFAALDGHITTLENLLDFYLRAADEPIMDWPMAEVEREEQRALEELYQDLRADADVLMEHRRRLHRIVKLLVFIRTYGIIKRALRRFLPAAALKFVAGAAAVVVYVEWRRGTVPEFENLGGIFTRLMCFFLLGYRPPVTEPQLWPTKPPPIPRTRSLATPRAHAATRTTAMAENPLFDEVVAIYDHLVDNPDAARIVLDAARSDFAHNDDEIAEVEIQLGYVLQRAGELMTEPMDEVEREAQRVFLVEAYHDLRARVDFLLERRRQLDQVVNLLLFIRTYAIIKRALRRLLPAAALVFVAGTAAVVVYVEWRRGTVPTFETLGMIFTRLMCFFL
uniref:Uncharacterized protein n=1 Tax=Oryza rufipogon TaxID=4529 RepID=A0A0E0N187_ORYRU